MDLDVLRSVQEKEFSILIRIVELCEENGLSYYLDSGTLIGAVRHQGPIPWDDDIDISMPCKDYHRFLEIAQEKLGNGHFVQTFKTDDLFYRSYAKIRDNNSTVMPVRWTGWKIHHGAFVDIFPLFYADSDKEVWFKTKLYELCGELQAQGYIKLKRPKRKTGLITQIRLFLHSVRIRMFGLLPISMRKILHEKILHYVYGREAGKYLCRADFRVRKFLAEDFTGEKTYLLYESRQFRVPNNFDRVLRTEYGDYMQIPPVEKRGTHGEMIVDLNRSYKEVLH